MIENTYRHMNESITPAPGLVEGTVQRAANASNRKRRLRFKPLLAAAALLLCLIVVTPALAAYVAPIYELMYQVTPELAQYFTPIQKSCEDNGIRMEVVSTYIHDSTAEIYITLRDLTGDRIDETTDLFDSYELHRAYSSTAHCELVGYEPETREATFLITITEWSNEKITGSKLTFSVREFLSHKVSEENIPVALELSAIGEAENLFTLDSSKNGEYTYVGGSSIKGEVPESCAVMIPGEPIYSLGDGMDITGIGFVDGRLHIQAATYDKLTRDTHGYFLLADADGGKVYPDSVCFAEGTGTDRRIDYQEFIFDVSQEELSRFTLLGFYYSSGMNTKGNWKITFPLTGGRE